jgi:hypothetical protein
MEHTMPMKPSIESTKLQQLLDELCVDLGFSLLSRDANRPTLSALTEVDALTKAIFKIEGLDPQGRKSLWLEVRVRVVKYLHA